MHGSNDPGPSNPPPSKCPHCGETTGYVPKQEQLKGGGTIVHVQYDCPSCNRAFYAYPYAPSADDVNRIMERGQYSRRKRR
jgi:transposase-like protein